jgi:hypothetical protein
VYHGKCTYFFVNNVLGFAKKENNKKSPFWVCPRINET